MNVLTVPRTVAVLEYKALRLPATVGASLVSRLDEESRIRLAFEKALGNVDAAVGKLFADEELATRGRKLAARAEVLETAVQLEAKAQARKAEADRQLREQKERAAQQRKAADQDKAAETRRLREQEKAAKQSVKAQADAKEKGAADAVRSQTEAQLKAERERLAQTEARIEERKQERTAAPKAQLEIAVDRKQDADAERAAADRLAQLADEEKARRQAAK